MLKNHVSKEYDLQYKLQVTYGEIYLMTWSSVSQRFEITNLQKDYDLQYKQVT